MSQYILAHDLGTSGNKATLFSTSGDLISSRIYSYDVHFSNGNWAEQNPDDWWKAVCGTTKALIKDTHIPPAEIAVVSFSGQMMGCLCVDDKGVPLHHSLIWADQRAREQAFTIEEKITQKDFYHISGHRNTASYGIQKLMWIRDHRPQIFDRTYKVLNAKDYMVYKLTGQFYTEYSDANSMGCFDLKNLEWSEELLAYAGISQELLPTIVKSTQVAGEVTMQAASETGLAIGTKVVIGAGDGVAANVGAGSIKPGKGFCCLGTSAWVAATTETPMFDEAMRIVCWAHAVPGLYSPNGTMQYAGGSYNWLKNTVCRAESVQAEQEGSSPYELMNRQADMSPPGSNGIIFLPYLLGERAPRWDPDAKGAFLGLKADTTRGDMIRSVLEGVTMNLSLCLDILKSQSGIESMLLIGGGAKGTLWKQIVADIFQMPIQIPHHLEEANSMGAAVIGGVGAGIYKDFNAIDNFLKVENIVEPIKDQTEIYQNTKKLFDESYDTLRKLFQKF